jgi:hypothetical protein
MQKITKTILPNEVGCMALVQQDKEINARQMKSRQTVDLLITTKAIIIGNC